MDFKIELVKARTERWICRSEAMPPNDYDHPVLIQFNDGHLALSDGGTVHDDKNISLWKNLAQ